MPAVSWASNKGCGIKQERCERQSQPSEGLLVMSILKRMHLHVYTHTHTLNQS